ncbi:MAG: NAD(P) transhydrogenase subunit alpha [Planctomycetaceae bacterium]
MGDRLSVGVPRESLPSETRVAMVPAQVPALEKAGLAVVVESAAGDPAGYTDELYVANGAAIGDRKDALGADIVLQVRTAAADLEHAAADLALLRSGAVVIGLCEPLDHREGVETLARTGATVFALEFVPRIARAQHMDALSSQSSIAGYSAVVMAADRLPKIFPMLTTAAGTVSPARVLVIGAGVTGLQAIATAKRLGAVVEAYDVRPAAQEDVESVGAKLLQLPLQPGDAQDAGGYAKDLGESFYQRQQEFLVQVVANVDVVITTAAIPGRPAPILLTEDAVRGMGFGSVIVDVAAPRGGNCAVTVPNEEVRVGGVTVLGPTNLPAHAPFHASQLYARNVTNFLLAMVKEGAFAPDEDDQVVSETLLARGGRVVHPRLAPSPTPEEVSA